MTTEKISGPERGDIRARARACGFADAPVRVSAYEVRWLSGLRTVIQAPDVTSAYAEMKKLLDLMDARKSGKVGS